MIVAPMGVNTSRDRIQSIVIILKRIFMITLKVEKGLLHISMVLRNRLEVYFGEGDGPHYLKSRIVDI